MKTIVMALYFVGVAVILDAKVVNELPNGGSLLSPDGKYITGIIPRIFGPLFQNLRDHSSKCSVGYVETMLDLMIDTDSALATNNGPNLRLLFKVFANLFQQQLPFIQNRILHEAFVQCVKGNKEEEARLANGRINWCAVNEFFTKASNTLNDTLN